MAGNEDRGTMMITAPMIDLLHGAPTRQHRTLPVHLVEQLPGWPGRPHDLPVRSDGPLVQAIEAVAAGIARFVVRTRDVAVE